MKTYGLLGVAALLVSRVPLSASAPITDADEYDYIVVGSGTGGIPTADLLSASGKRVLLIERGPPSSYRWGGRRRGAWLENSNLTRFDVPGLYNVIWDDNVGIKCPDIVPMAGCVVGGGSAINAGLWFKPNSRDWDTNFPVGWHAEDLEPATERAFSRMPWTDHPSTDGILYNPQGYNLISHALADIGWENVTANGEAEAKNRTFSLSEYFFLHGERGGPMETYLVSAASRSNFKLWMNTTVSRLVRDGDTVTGVQVEGDNNGTVSLAEGGRVILSAGVFGTAKILFRSGIGPTDQLQVVKAAESDALIDSSEWIDLPVGYDLDDHANTNILFEHPDIINYDFNAAYDNPIPEDAEKYLANRSGILAQAAPNIEPIFWEGIKGEDSIDRYFQWTAYIGGPATDSGYNTSGVAAALGLGKSSRGRITIDSSLTMNVTTLPYFNDPGNNDFEAVVSTLTEVVDAISAIPGATLINPAPGQDIRAYIQSIPVNLDRTANHWVGTAHLGLDSALDGGKSVVDLNAQVYGTKNLHIIDASIINGITTANPSGAIISAAEKVVEIILKL
ncbi:cellobiose dehydrogenase [Xylariales sp. AK1849]|nr:cellobiose dehydrogenase [Xylariales sp. AK1849]